MKKGTKDVFMKLVNLKNGQIVPSIYQTVIFLEMPIPAQSYLNKFGVI